VAEDPKGTDASAVSLNDLVIGWDEVTETVSGAHGAPSRIPRWSAVLSDRVDLQIIHQDSGTGEEGRRPRGPCRRPLCQGSADYELSELTEFVYTLGPPTEGGTDNGAAARPGSSSDDAIIVAAVLRSVVRRAGKEAVRRHWPGTEDGLAAIWRVTSLEGRVTEPIQAPPTRREARGRRPGCGVQRKWKPPEPESPSGLHLKH
jgi:hypothetical protein